MPPDPADPADISSPEVAEELFVRCADGDADAWVVFLKLYRPLLAFQAQNELQRYGASQEANVDDCVSEVLRALLEKKGEKLRVYHGKCRPSTWLGITTCRLVRNWMRKEGRYRAAAPLEVVVSQFVQKEGGALERLLDAEGKERLATAISGLGARERQALRLTVEHGYTQRRAAKVMHLSRGGVAELLFRCRKHLREKLLEES